MNATILARIAALDLSTPAFKAVLAIVADMQAAHEAAIEEVRGERARMLATARQRRHRAKSTGEEADLFDAAAPAGNGIVADRDIERDASVTERDINKERIPPTPPKKEIYNTTLRDAPAPAREPAKACSISPEALDLADAIGAEAGYTAANWPPGWCGAAWEVQRFLNEGYTSALIRMACTAVMRRGRGAPEYFAYFIKPIIDMRARLEAPLPQVKPHQLEVIDGGRSHAGTGFGGQRGRIVGGRAVGRNYGSVCDALEALSEEFASEAARRGEGPYIPTKMDWGSRESGDGGL
jgi:hypothetical protein